MRLISLFLLFALNYSCTQDEQKKETSYNLIPNKYAKGFEISQLDEGYRIKVLNPKNGEKMDEIYLGQKGDAKAISKPIKSSIPFSSTHIGFIDLLNKTHTIKGVTYPEGIFNKKIRAGIKNSTIKNIGSDMEPNKELILNLKPDIIFTFPNATSYEWMENFNLNTIVVTEFMEEHPLAQAEWIRFFGYIFGKQKQADSIFHHIDSTYLAIKNKQKKKQLYVLAGELYDGNWTLPGGKSFTANLIEDAGAHYYNFNDTSYGSYKIDYELVLHEQEKLNYWVMLTFDYQNITKDYLLQKNPKYTYLNVLDTNRMIVCNSAKKPYFEKGITQPHLILQELVNAFEGMDNKNKYFNRIK